LRDTIEAGLAVEEAGNGFARGAGKVALDFGPSCGEGGAAVKVGLPAGGSRKRGCSVDRETRQT